MTQTRETFKLLTALVMTAGLLAGGAWWLLKSELNPLSEVGDRESSAAPVAGQRRRTTPAISLAVAPDAETLAVGNYGSEIILWDLATRSASRLTQHRGRVNALAMVGNRLVSGSGDGSIRTWDLNNAYEVQQPLSAGARVLSLAALSDRTVAAGYSDGVIRIWNVVAGELVQSIVAHEDQVTTLAVSPKDSSLLISGSHDTTIKVWQLRADAAELRHQWAVDSKVNSIDLHPNGTLLASGDYAGAIRFWDVASGTEDTSRSLPGHTFIIGEVEFNTDGSLLVSAGYDEKVKVWDLGTGDEFRAFDLSPEQAGFVFAADFLSIEDDLSVATAGYDGVIRLLDLDAGEVDYL